MKRLVAFAAAAFAALALALPGVAAADAAGVAIAAALNKRDLEGMMQMLDVDAIVRLAVKDLGLSATDREAVRRGLPKGLRTNLSMSMRGLESSDGSARFLRTGSRDGRTFTLVRYDLGDNGIDYVEYFLTAGGRIEDWYVHSVATLYTSAARLDLATMLKTDTMLFGLFGGRFTSEADVKPFTRLRTHLQAQDFAKAYKTLEEFPESYRKTRQWALMRVSYGGRIDEATHRAALRDLAANFGADPELQFMLIDHYFFEQQFERGLKAVAGLERAIGGEDAATANLRGNLYIAMNRFDEAAKACRRGIQLEPDHRPVYWCLIAVGLGAKSGKITVEGLTAYEKAFGVEFDPAKLVEQAAYKDVANTPEFTAWAKKRRR